MIKRKAIRIDEELWNKAKQQARREGKLLEAWIAQLIKERLQKEEAGGKS